MKNFRNIIGLMTFALLGLIAFQWYWIENAISVKREQFDRKVVDAMNQTASRIEKQEVIFLASQKLKEQENLALATLTEKPKTKTVLKKIRKKVPVSKTRFGGDDLAAISPQSPQINTPFNQSSDSFPISFGQNRLMPSMDEFNGNASFSDFFVDERNLIPENRMHFFKEMMKEQNRMWQQLGLKANDILEQDRGIEEIISIIDHELSMVISNQPQSRRRPVNGRLQEGSFQYEIYAEGSTPFIDNRKSVLLNDSLRVNKVPNLATNKSKIRLDSGTKKKQQALAKNNLEAQNKPKPEPEFEWVEVEEEVESADIEKTKNKAALVKDVFTDFLQGNRNIYERLNREMLDTLLRQELADRGIEIPFEYSVKDKDEMVFASFAMNSNPSLTDESFKVKLFPNDTHSRKQLLYVYFPEKENFILSNMWTVFGSSIFLILMIGGIFYSSVNTMLKQKKLSMIKNDFINNMTHEFKTPISTISLAIEVLKDKSMNRQPEKYLNIIRDENKRLGTQVEKVLQMAVLDKGEMKLNFSPVNLEDIVLQVSQNLGVQVEKREGKLNIELNAENPEVEADEVHMTNIVYNLIDNANKYSPEKPNILVKIDDIESGVKLTVEDKGLGMSKEQLSHIFEKFYRVSTGDVHDVKGFGLGLSYVKKMVDLHNGKIEVTSTPKEGTIFELSFNRFQNA